MRSVQVFLTPAAGKALIAKAVVRRPEVQEALRSGTVLVIGGTTNVYVANELLKCINAEPCVTFPRFHRGVAVPPGAKLTSKPQLGDLVIRKGVPEFTPQEALPEICNSLGAGDVIFKGANALDIWNHTAGILLGNTETGGTIMEASKAVLSRRARLILPVGVEKRVEKPLHELQAMVNDPEASGLRFFTPPGEAFTELDALRLLTGAEAEIIASGAVNGGEGGVYLQVYGADPEAVREVIAGVAKEKNVEC